MIIKYEELLKELEEYPNLKRYVEHFYNTNGGREDPMCLPYLIVWIRHRLDDEGQDAADWFNMPEDVREDFWSWGHNSRWANTFEWYLEQNFNWCVSRCLELACFEDFNVEEYIKQTEAENEK